LFFQLIFDGVRRELRRHDHTICTVIVPAAVFMVRTYATTTPYERRLRVHIRPDAGRNRRLGTGNQPNAKDVFQVRQRNIAAAVS
jgi:hypothetical protein